MASRKDYYDILGIRRGATPEEIEKAFQKLTRTYQFIPNPGNKTAATCFKEISEAYEILSDKEKRAEYDLSGDVLSFSDAGWDYDLEEEEEENLHFEGFEDALGQCLGTAELAVRLKPQRGKDVQCVLEVSFEEAVKGKIKEIEVEREIPCSSCSGWGIDPESPRKTCERCGGAGQVQIGLPPTTFVKICPRCHGQARIPSQPCQRCSGKGRLIEKERVLVQVPPGAGEGCRMFLKGKGQAGRNGGASGDLVTIIRVMPHPYFQRKGDDLHLTVPLSFWEAALGTEIEVPTLEGMARVAIPSGAQDGGQLRLAGKGVPFFGGGDRGDLVMSLRIIVPHELGDRAKEILGELRRLNPQNPREGCHWRRIRRKMGKNLHYD